MYDDFIAAGISDVDAKVLVDLSSTPDALRNPLQTVSDLVNRYAARIPTGDMRLIGYNKFVAMASVIFVGEHRNIKDAVIPQYFDTYIDHITTQTSYERERLDKDIWAGVDIMQKSEDPDLIPIVWTTL